MVATRGIPAGPGATLVQSGELVIEEKTVRFSQVAWRSIGKTALRNYWRDDVVALASEMAYNFVFALFPFALFLAALADVVGLRLGVPDLSTPAGDTLASVLGPAISEALQGVLRDQQHPGALSLGALLAFGFASNGVTTVMKACNRAYGVEETRGVVVRRLVALGLTLMLSLVLLGGFGVLVFGGRPDPWLATGLSLETLVRFGWFVVRLALVLAGVSLALAVLYWRAPNVKQQFRWTTPGAVVAALVWGLVTLGFGLYVRVLGASTWRTYYGILAGPILFLFYLWLTSLVLLLGAELNAESTRRYDPATIRDKRSDPHKQRPGKEARPHPQAARKAGGTRGEDGGTSAPS